MGYNVNISAPNLVCVCVDTVSDYTQIGRIYHKYNTEPEKFNTLSQLLSIMDQLFDRIGYPQNFTAERNFEQEKEIRRSAEKEMQKMDAEKMLENKGEMATFVVHVQYRQHATWQGEVVWADQNKKCRFRSALELLKLIDNALDETQGEESKEEE